VTEHLHIETPLLRSAPMTAAAGAEVWLKLESAQPVGSFKIRGIGAACQACAADGAQRLVSSSGGNAGYAVAYAGRELGIPVEVFVPRTTPEWMRDVIRAEGAVVTEHGDSWDDAHARAMESAGGDGTAYIHPFDDARIWRGHASLIREVASDLARPDAVVLSVGGGGLMIGVLEGMHEVGWHDTPVVAVETQGAASFAKSVAAGELVTLPSIDSIATTLGARTVAAQALAWIDRHEIRNCVVTDKAAVDACTRFADDHRILVEPACGASLAAVLDRDAALANAARILVIVCGGAGANLTQLRHWQSRV
jgi:L-serine/L-threonine ammonia-lyase